MFTRDGDTGVNTLDAQVRHFGQNDPTIPSAEIGKKKQQTSLRRQEKTFFFFFLLPHPYVGLPLHLPYGFGELS